MEPVSFLCQRYVALEHGTSLHSCQVGDISSHSLLASMGLGNIFWPLLYSLPCHHDLISFDVKYCQIQCRATDMFKRIWPLHFSTTLWFSTDLDSQTSCSSVSCRWCGKHYGLLSIKVTSCQLQLIIQEADLETLFRYLGACMPQWQVVCIWRKVFIIDLRLDDNAGVRC